MWTPNHGGVRFTFPKLLFYFLAVLKDYSVSRKIHTHLNRDKTQDPIKEMKESIVLPQNHQVPLTVQL
jgi:hypothetical protein